MIHLANPDALEPWQVTASTIWLKLGCRFFQVSEDQLPLQEFGRECEMLAAVATWFHFRGNITHAAVFLGTSRRSLRARLERWVELYPHLVPKDVAVKGSTLFKAREPTSPTNGDLTGSSDERPPPASSRECPSAEEGQSE